jgi:hypothetical protein
MGIVAAAKGAVASVAATAAKATSVAKTTAAAVVSSAKAATAAVAAPAQAAAAKATTAAKAAVATATATAAKATSVAKNVGSALTTKAEQVTATATSASRIAEAAKTVITGKVTDFTSRQKEELTRTAEGAGKPEPAPETPEDALNRLLEDATKGIREEESAARKEHLKWFEDLVNKGVELPKEVWNWFTRQKEQEEANLSPDQRQKAEESENWTEAIVECPRGLIYTRGLFQACEKGYYQGNIPGAGVMGMGQACVCAKGYELPHETKEGVGIEGITQMLPMIVIVAIIIAVLGMFRR